MTTVQSALERIPHLCKKVCGIWGTQELEAYLNSLVMDSRDGQRSGFPLDVAAELLWLVEVNKLRRAMEISAKLKISLAAAHAKLDLESATGQTNAWGDPSSDVGINKGLRRDEVSQPARRHTDQSPPSRPRRRREENTAGGIIFRLLTNKFFLFMIIFLLALKSMWPHLKGLL